MDDLFKQNLLDLRSPAKPSTFGEALFPKSLWKPRRTASTEARKIVLTEDYSEKKQVLESFDRFAQEKLEKAPEGMVKVEGGELALKPEDAWVASPFAADKLMVEASLRELILTRKAPGQVKVIFVTETFRAPEEVQKDLKEGFINELLAGFPLKTAELFERMIMAMKLVPDEVLVYPVEVHGADAVTDVMTLTAHFKPEALVTLGAKASQKILKTNDRLSLIHGQFFPRKTTEGHQFQVVPLFHPTIIESNQNMKKTAWSDMQKIMKLLKKLS